MIQKKQHGQIKAGDLYPKNLSASEIAKIKDLINTLTYESLYKPHNPLVTCPLARIDNQGSFTSERIRYMNLQIQLNDIPGKSTVACVQMPVDFTDPGKDQAAILQTVKEAFCQGLEEFSAPVATRNVFFWRIFE